MISQLILIMHRKNFRVIRVEGRGEITEREGRHFWRAQAKAHLRIVRKLSYQYHQKQMSITS